MGTGRGIVELELVRGWSTCRESSRPFCHLAARLNCRRRNQKVLSDALLDNLEMSGGWGWATWGGGGHRRLC